MSDKRIFQSKIFKQIILCTLGFSLMSCASGPVTESVVPEAKYRSVDLIKAESELSELALLDIGLIVFEPGVPDDPRQRREQNVSEGIRQAESRYLPYVLRNTLENSNQWGAIRVLPQADPSAELLVTAEILKSDGVKLSLQVSAWDSTGRAWIDKVYTGDPDPEAYREGAGFIEPFQALLNQIANDLYRVRSSLDEKDLERVINVSQLRYAAALSPEAFGEHLVENPDGSVQLNRLPATNDPMFSRVKRIRQGEYLFVDAVDQHYEGFQRDMANNYLLWRRFSHEQVLEGEKIRQAKSATSDRRGSLRALRSRYNDFAELKYQQDTLKELAESFNAELAPTVLELEGEVIKLNGNLEAQYVQWRRLLRQIYAKETGFPLSQ